jgi:hypothetical protein
MRPPPRPGPVTARTLHVHVGDHSAETLRRSGVPGTVVVAHDPMCFGPTPRGVTGEAWYRMRAAYLTAAGVPVEAGALARNLAREDAALDQPGDADEIVLWFDHCLFDQSILIRLLARLAPRPRGAPPLSLICIGAFPGFVKFRGLGELSAGQMAPLVDTRHAVRPAETRLAAAAWEAFQADDPRALARVCAGDTSALPFLGAALARHLEESPSAREGLSRLEREVLDAVAAGATAPGAVFAGASDREERPFFGDTTVWECLDHLAQAPHPALRLRGPGPLPRWDLQADRSAWHVELTDTGRALRDGRADWVALNGIDRWLGGVHLQGRTAAWRWDGEARALRLDRVA